MKKYYDTFFNVNPSGSIPADVQERAKEDVENALYSTGRFNTSECDQLADGIMMAVIPYLAGASSGMHWVKASERLPNHHKEICVKYHGRYYAGKRNHDSVHPAIYIEMPSGSVTTRDCEYLDESSPSSMQEENERLRVIIKDLLGDGKYLHTIGNISGNYEERSSVVKASEALNKQQ